ncbi:AraC family transcriptional regulator [Sinorhizobium fredii USDA 205]|uniref:Helix-turn-helix domain-containing protein n=1 Tax=Rhizobium fredii TaxID=380 RepID=A0A844A4E9_RHIFR|nr:AraC family transcriptional regulator [Sinorhizobium fredii]ASY71678.1 Transcriptional regulator, AraC family [Sinorhizobium fredii CCBAU 83666]KSV87587.1 AraC family transcriptional regulator [Sinorhizobium fredii USDA 205]MQW98623.1 helix-turn-helix domain-containing protein [Sinorhizobium fredii]MQX07843.1 helix-turn-helix domain-containing protein [Sinorhizobium fredii]UTY46910.1 AraC family transcriptional regulator [Sinorhizobium fredii]
MGDSVLQQLIDRGPVMRTVSLPRGRQSLHTMPTSTGYEIRTDGGYDWDGRKRGQTPFTVLQHTIGGAGNLRYEHRTYRLREGDTLLLLVPHNHRYWLEEDGRWEFFWISMNGEEALRIHRAILAVTGPVLKLQPETVEHLADCSRRLITGGETPGCASAIAYEAAMALYDDVFGSHPVISEEYRKMQHVIDHILANLEKPLPVEELARVSGLSRAHFSRVFAASEGMPPAEFVLQKRLQRAVKLLTKTADLPVKEVAILSGFDDPNYFAKVFRRVFGASPTEFRTTGMYASVPAKTQKISESVTTLAAACD